MSLQSDYEEPSEAEQAAVALAERMARTDLDVDDETFARLKAHCSDEQVVELAAWVALQLFYSAFNRALRVEAEGSSARTTPGDSLGQPAV